MVFISDVADSGGPGPDPEVPDRAGAEVRHGEPVADLGLPLVQEGVEGLRNGARDTVESRLNAPPVSGPAVPTAPHCPVALMSRQDGAPVQACAAPILLASGRGRNPG
jgi:hypothetical protein